MDNTSRFTFSALTFLCALCLNSQACYAGNVSQAQLEDINAQLQMMNAKIQELEQSEHADKAKINQLKKIRDLVQSLAGEKSNSTPVKQGRSEHQTEVSSSQTSSIVPDGFSHIRGVLTYGLGFNGIMTLETSIIAVFDDGTFTTDIHRAFNSGVMKSRREAVDQWGQWKKRGDKLLLKWYGDDDYETTSGDWRAEPGQKGVRITGCYGNITGSNNYLYGGSTSVGGASSYCFSENGTFSHDRSVFGTSPNATISKHEKGNRGHYHIDGYGILFTYLDGSTIKASFAYQSDDKSHISINDTQFF